MMYFGQASLHPPVIRLPEHKLAVEQEFAQLRDRPRPANLGLGPPGTSVVIPLTTVSLNSGFDANIDVWPNGATAAAASHLTVDSGNSMLIMPRWENLQALPNFGADYEVLGTGFSEPWGCPANIVRGPINLPTADGGIYTIEGCVFYACTADNPDGSSGRTGNFGAGCILPWTANSWNTPDGLGVTMQAPLSYNASYPYAEFSYAASANIFGAVNTPRVSVDSFLTIYQEQPAGYTIFDICRDKEWMALIPMALSIGTTRTSWPGTVASPIAMIDTGGGPVFLSDPNGYVCNSQWPDPVDNPDWAATSSVCQSTAEAIEIELGDGSHSISYRIDPSQFPAAAQGLTLVMCQVNHYMMGEQGMNIGGVSALVNDILVDYRDFRVGLKPK